MDFEGIQVPHNHGPMVQKLNVPRENDIERELLNINSCMQRQEDRNNNCADNMDSRTAPLPTVDVTPQAHDR